MVARVPRSVRRRPGATWTASSPASHTHRGRRPAAGRRATTRGTGAMATACLVAPGGTRAARSGAVQLADVRHTWATPWDRHPATIGGPWECRDA